jgi:hypothetical protein
MGPTRPPASLYDRLRYNSTSLGISGGVGSDPHPPIPDAPVIQWCSNKDIHPDTVSKFIPLLLSTGYRFLKGAHNGNCLEAVRIILSNQWPSSKEVPSISTLRAQAADKVCEWFCENSPGSQSALSTPNDHFACTYLGFAEHVNELNDDRSAPEWN